MEAGVGIVTESQLDAALVLGAFGKNTGETTVEESVSEVRSQAKFAGKDL